MLLSQTGMNIHKLFVFTLTENELCRCTLETECQKESIVPPWLPSREGVCVGARDVSPSLVSYRNLTDNSQVGSQQPGRRSRHVGNHGSDKACFKVLEKIYVYMHLINEPGGNMQDMEYINMSK